MKCTQCQNEMVKDCNVNVEFDMAGLSISKGKKLFNKVTAKPKERFAQIVGM